MKKRSRVPFPFEIPFEQLQTDLDTYVDEVFNSLRSEFLTMPKGDGFVEYPVFEEGYEALKRVTVGFRKLLPDVLTDTVCQVPITFVVLRAMLGFTPPEWAYVTTQRTGVQVPQGAARTLDRTVRMKPSTPLRNSGGVTFQRIRAMVETACQLLSEGAIEAPGVLHRLDKADTKHGLSTIHPIADLGLPYAMVLYERFLGRPFAGHRDSISELVGDLVESAIETVLTGAGISFRKTKRAERVLGFDQAPDFIVPDEFNPQIIIEAKLTEDDGTARDKITRVQHLGSLSMQGRNPNDLPRFEVIACIAGRGFKVRREDMKKLVLATRGKVFTLENLTRLVECSRLHEFKTK
jgi:hypothetical protein